MLASLALIFLMGLVLGSVFTKLKMPSLIGRLLTGIILGPYVLNLLSGNLLSISADLRQLALIIILTRAGLALNVSELKKVGRPAFMLCFVPACCEIIGVVILAPIFLGVTVLEAAIMGAVIAAVSPAVVVPRMLKLMETGYGKEKSIPQMIMAGASVDDVFVIVLFYSFTSLAQGEALSIMSFLQIPISICLGIALGILAGFLIVKFFEKFPQRDTVKVIVMLSVSFLIMALETYAKTYVSISGLLAIMAMGATILKKNGTMAVAMSSKFNKLWVGAEIFLFALVGATVDIRYALSAGLMAIAVILCAIIFRMIGVYFCVVGSKLTQKERLFCGFAYIPKATVQAAIGAIPLTMGLACGNIVLTVAVLSILITAPLGAFLIDISYKKLLSKGN